MTKTSTAKSRANTRELRQRQLILAVIDSISRRGFSDTTLRHVADKAKVSYGVVNYHFPSKETLYDAALGFLAEEHHEIWRRYYQEAGPEPADKLAAIISADFDPRICTHKRLAAWFAFWGQAKYRPNYLKIHNKYDNERYERIEEICAHLVREGGYDLEPANIARTVESLSDGSWLGLMLYPNEADRTKYRADCLTALAHFFPKHFPRPEKPEIGEV